MLQYPCTIRLRRAVGFLQGKPGWARVSSSEIWPAPSPNTVRFHRSASLRIRSRDNEVYSWAAHQPAKSLVRAHLRMAVNKPQCRRISINGYRMRLLCRIDHLVKNGKITPHRKAPLRPAHGHASDDEWLDGRRGLLSAQEFRTVLPQDPRSPTPNAHRVSEKTGDQCRYQGQRPHAPRSRKFQGSRSRSVHTIYANVRGPRLGSSCSKSRCHPSHPPASGSPGRPLSCGADIPSPRGSLAFPSNACLTGKRQRYSASKQPQDKRTLGRRRRTAASTW